LLFKDKNGQNFERIFKKNYPTFLEKKLVFGQFVITLLQFGHFWETCYQYRLKLCGGVHCLVIP
jgi:hypothetical protein